MNYKVIFLGLLLSMLACDDNEALIKPTAYQLQTGSGSFIYNQFEPFSSKPIEVFYHIPENVDNTLPILISLHGADRNGNNHRNTLVNKSNQFKFIVIAPQFTVNYFPGGDAYNLVNIFIDRDNPSVTSLNPENQWTFSVLDPIFNYIKSITNNNSAQSNAVFFGSKILKIDDMIKKGLFMNLISIVILTTAVYWILTIIWGFEENYVIEYKKNIFICKI